MRITPEFITVHGADGPLGALRWRGAIDAPTVMAVHGITANAWHFDTLAHHLAGAVDLIAVDLRGRGRSEQHAGPFGIRQHAADISAIVAGRPEPVTVVGHSMGAFVAMMAAEHHPGLLHQLVLVDSGTPIELVNGADAEVTLERTLGFAIDRLRTVWPDRVSYATMWAAHPAFAGGLSINLERNLLADLVETEGGFRAAVDEGAVMIDGRELLTDDEIRSLLAVRSRPAFILRATRGLRDALPPLVPAAASEQFAHHHWRTVPDTNHSTILLGDVGASAVAATVLEAVRSPARWP